MRRLKKLSKIKFILPITWFKRLNKRQKLYVELAVGAIFVVFVPLAIATLTRPTQSEAAWYNTWQYRKMITITNSSGGTLSDFQTSFTINTTDTSKFRSDCYDIRVTSSDGTTELPVWIDPTYPCRTATTKVWTKVSSIPTSGATIYVYYGNSFAPNVQSGSNVFLAFDDFDNASLAAQWTAMGGTWTEAGGIVTQSGTGGEEKRLKLATSTNNFVVEAIVKPITFGNDARMGVVARMTANEDGYSAVNNGLTNLAVLDDWISWGTPKALGFTLATGNWYKYKLAVNGNNEYAKAWLSTTTEPASWTVTEAHSTKTASTAGLNGGTGNGGAGSTMSFDNFFVRAYASTDPTTTLGNEEINKEPVAYWKFDEGKGYTASNSTWKRAGSATNLITNPSFEVDTTGWTSAGLTSFASSSETRAWSGTKYAKAVGNNSSQYPQINYNFSGLADGTYAIQFRYKTNVGTGFWYMWAISPSLTALATGNLSNTGVADSNGWTTVKTTFTVTAGLSNFQLWIYLNGAGVSNGTLLVDGVEVETGSTNHTYCDGSLLGNGSHAWNGTTNASTSTCDYGNDGAIDGATWQPDSQCISGKCLQFDGTDDYVGVDTTPFANLTQGSISFWAKRTESSANEKVLFSISRNANSTQTELFADYDMRTPDYNSFYVVLRVDGTEQWLAAVSNTFFNATNNVDTWHYFTITHDGTAPLIYIDGKLASITFVTSTDKTKWFKAILTDATSKADTMSIGTLRRNSTITAPFPGGIDDAKIYPYARTAAQVKSDYASRGSVKGVNTQAGAKDQAWISNGLVGYWKMDEASGNAADSSGNGYTGTVTNATYLAGKYGNGLNFDASGEHLRVSSTSYNKTDGQEITVSAWIKPNWASGYQDLVVNRTDAAYNWMLYQHTTDGSIQFHGNAQNKSTYVPTNGVWTHIVATVDAAGNYKLYANGVVQQTVAGYQYHADSPGTLSMGDFGSNQEPYPGMLDEVRIYNRALSSKETSDLYNWAPGPYYYADFEDGSGTTLSDKSGNNFTGAFSGNPAWVSGKYGKALYFDGSDDYVTAAGVGSNVASQEITIEFWQKVSEVKNQSTFYIGTDSPDRINFHAPWSNSAVYWDFGTCCTDGRLSYTPVSITGTWQHFALVASTAGDYMKIYRNGVLEASKTGHSTFAPSTYSLILGRDGSGGSNYYKGAIDEFKIYNYVRTSKQIIEDMNGNHPTGGSPVGSAVGHWKFNEGADNTCSGGTNDACNSGSAGSVLDGAASNTSWTNSGKFGKALSFNGTSSYVNVGKNTALDNAGDITISAWVNKASTTANKREVFRKGLWQTYSIYFNVGASGEFMYQFRDGTDWRSYTYNFTTGTINTWYYIAATFSPSSQTLKLYIDGKLVQTTTGITYTPYINTDNCIIGGSYAEFFDGLIDEVKFYNYVLTDDEIKVDMNQGKSLVLGALSDNSSYEKNAANQEYCVPGDSTSCASPVGRWDLEEGSGITANDSSGNNNTGVLIGSTHIPTWTSGKYGKGVRFDAVDDYIDAGTNAILDITGNFSAETWFKAENPSNAVNSQFIISKDYSTGNRGWGLKIYSNKVYLEKGGTNFIISNSSILPNTWYHIAATFDGTYWYLYINGKLDLARVSGTAILSNASAKVELGARHYVGVEDRFVGTIDQAMIFNYYRTPAQIAWDYNKGQPIAQYKFDECTGTIANNSATSSGMFGTITIGGTGSQTTAGNCTTPSDGTGAWYNGKNGKYNSAMNFDGTDDYVIVSPSSPYDFSNTQSFSTSAWIYSQDWHSGDEANPVIQKYDWGGHNGWMLGIRSGNCFGMSLFSRALMPADETKSACIVANDEISLNAWHHVVGVVDRTSNNIYFYLDGRLKRTTSISGWTSASTAAYNLLIGHYGSAISGWGYAAFQGKIDDARIYNYALNATQVKQLMNQSSAVRYGPVTGTP